MSTFAIAGADVFDGFDVLRDAVVVVEHSTIVAAGRDVEPPQTAEVIEARGCTLLPGLIDSHVHLGLDWQLRRALAFGVTTVLDMWNEPSRVSAFKRRAAEDPGFADLRSAGYGATCPGGHPSQMGPAVFPTLQSAAEADAFVAARIAEGSDWIKIIHEPLGGVLPTLDRETVTALVDAAHRHGKLAVVHVGCLEGAEIAVEAGADAHAHAFGDRVPDDGYFESVADAGVCVIPTFSVLGGASRRLPDDPRLRPFLDDHDIAHLTRAAIGTAEQFANACEVVGRLARLGVPILAGTDAASPGTMYGVSLHEELELLVHARLSPSAALTAATAAPARVFGLLDRGRISAGLRADLVLVGGDPLSDITATRDIQAVWRGGVRVDRDDALRAKAAASTKWSQSLETPDVGDGLISDFEDGTPATRFGSGWTEWTDRVLGGRSRAQLHVLEGDAASGRHSLEVSGFVEEGPGPRWAGAAFMPGSALFEPVNLAKMRGVEFFGKGDGNVYGVCLYSASTGQLPVVRPFTARDEWQRHRFELGDFDGVDPSGMLAIAFCANIPGSFRFQLDDVRLLPQR